MPNRTSLATHVSGSSTAEMQTSQRRHDMAVKAIKAYHANFPGRVPDRNTPCTVDIGQDNAGCTDFWLTDTDVSTAAVCHRHQRVHICFCEGLYCDRCNIETGVCPVTNWPNLRRFGNSLPSTTVDVDSELLLADYARAFGILTRIDVAPRELCGAQCPRWWPHPNGRAWICQTHHHVHQCARDQLFCEFVTDDNGNSETTACPISGHTGRSGRVFTSAKTRAPRAQRIKVAVTSDWVAACVRAVIRDLPKAHLESWTSVLWTIFDMSGLAKQHDHQWTFDAVIGVLTIIPTQGVEIKGRRVIPELPYMTAFVPDKLLAGMCTRTVTMPSGYYTNDLRPHEIKAGMNTARRITVATRDVFDTLLALPDTKLAELAVTTMQFFPNPLSTTFT